VAVFSNRDLASLRRTLHSVWDVAREQHEIIVLTSRLDDDTAGYLVRQYQRGRIASFGLDRPDRRGWHCDLDRAFPVSTGEYVARVGDDIDVRTGWLNQALDVMEAIPTIGCLGLIRGSGRHRPGRLRSLGSGALQADDVDTRCFVTRRHLFEQHDRKLPRRSVEGSCAYQARLRKLGFEIAYLPGLVMVVETGPQRPAQTKDKIDGDIPVHDPLTLPMRKIRQTYELGEEVLLTCVACGNGALEVLAAEVEFCAGHSVPVGHTYTLHCHRCGKLQFEEDLQLACPGDVHSPPYQDHLRSP
jgi:hypothetical protein